MESSGKNFIGQRLGNVLMRLSSVVFSLQKFYKVWHWIKLNRLDELLEWGILSWV